jgi:hypothetical protein
MFSHYGNHAAQQMADVGGTAGNWLWPNILHLPGALLRRSVNITILVEKTTRPKLLCVFASSRGKNSSRKDAKTQRKTKCQTTPN